MEYSTPSGREGICAAGVAYEVGSIYERLGKLTDVRKAQGKQYSLRTLLLLIVLAKLCGQNTPVEIADWAKNRQGELVRLLGLKRDKMPHHNTYRRVLAQIVYVEEIERLVGEYSQQGKQGLVYAMDGKAVRGMRSRTESQQEYLLSVYDVQYAKTLGKWPLDARRTRSPRRKISSNE